MSAILDANRRFYILELLAEDAGSWMSARIIQRALPALTVVHDAPLDTITRDLRWLAQRGLVDTTVDPAGMNAKLTQMGEDTRSGRMTVEGVDRPPLD
jgi:Fe2+ or Zn2+ uptake regulation protein